MTDRLRIANFMDSPLELLERKGNLASAKMLYNPKGQAEKVVHFTASQGDLCFAKQFEKNSIEIYPFFDNRVQGNFRRVLLALVSLGKVVIKIKRERINVIRGRLPYFGSLLGCLAGRILGIPVVISLGGDNRLVQELEGKYYFGSRLVSYGVEKVNLHLCDAIIAPNQFTKEYVAGIIGVKRAKQKVVILPWILERQAQKLIDRKDVYANFGLCEHFPFVTVIGAINKYKYSETMFEVARHVGQEVQVVFCGDGSLRAQGEEQLRSCENVHFVGWCDNVMVLSLINAASAVLVPMSGFVLLEAASLGKPVIASQIEWHGELVEDGVSGLLVEPTDVEAWVEGVNKLITNQALAANLGEQIRERFEKDYDQETLQTKEIDLYKALQARSMALNAAGDCPP